MHGLALFGISNGVVKRVAPAANYARSQLVAADVQGVKRDHVAFAEFTQQVLFGDAAIVHDDRRSGRSANAHLFLFSARLETGRISVHDEGAELLAINL